MEKVALVVASAVFLIVSIMHLLRLILNLPVKIGNFNLPLRISLYASAVTVLLSVWMFTLGMAQK
ncbi:MAG: hypothetical protein PHP17_04925 [Candidatus Omnitrophica bacterium]|nr:hypothetical protein [Candidatus Omnitrophota bacterium]